MTDRSAAQLALRRFAAATNLSIPGRAFCTPRNRQLARVLRAMGARLGTPDATAVFADSPVEGMITVTADSVFAPDGSILSPADSPEDRLAWARSHMPVTLGVASSLDLTGVRIGVALVLEPKTAVLALALADAGAEVFVFGHAEEVRPAVADALRQAGLTVFADPAPTREEQLARDFLSCGLHLLLDDGSHLIRLAHEVEGALDHLIGAAEETTSGLRPLREWQQAGRLRIPVVASNDARTKTLFDNAYGTGQSCLMTILDLLDPGQHGWPLWDKQVVVAGYGDVGRGFAKLTAALGGRVAVAELDPVRELQARMDGHRTGPLDALVTDADLVVSATGVRHTITASQLAQMRQDTVVAVIGGVEQEVAMTDAEAAGARWVSDDVMALRSGRAVCILDRGNCINVTAGEGNPIEIMDLSFGVQVAAIRHLLNYRGLPPGVHSLPREADDAVARAALTTATPGSPHPPLPRHAPEPVQVYSAGLVIPITAPSVLGGAVAVRGRRILHVGERDWVVRTLREDGIRFTEVHWPGVILPGLVNAHTHLQYTSMAVLGHGQYHGFDDWAQAFNQIYDAQALDWTSSARQGAQLSLRYGVTTVADVVTDPSAASALHDAGLHGVAYWEVMDWTNEDWASHGQDEVIAALEGMPTPPAVGLSPHAPYSLDARPLLDLPDIARQRGLRLHIHLGESQLEAEWAEGREGDLADLWRSDVSTSFTALRARGVGHSAARFVDELGVLGPDCHVAHGVYMTADDRRRLRARSTTVALCPRSNRVIGLAAPPVAAYLAEGNQIAVGTDSLSSSPSLDVLGELPELYDLAREQGYAHTDLGRRLLHAATLGGATALGLGTGRNRVGQLQAGAIADMVILDVPVSDVIGTIDDVVRLGASRQVATLIEGQLRWRDDRFPGMT